MEKTTVGILVGLAAVAVIGGVAYAASDSSSGTKTPPKPVDLSPDACMKMIAGLPPTVAMGAVQAVAIDWQPGRESQIAATMADYLAAHNYPNVATCLRQNPMLVYKMQPAALDCDKVLAAIPAGTWAAIGGILKTNGIDPSSASGEVGSTIATYLRTIGRTKEADCIERGADLSKYVGTMGGTPVGTTGGTTTGGLPGGIDPQFASCKDTLAAVPSSVWLAVASTSPKSGADVANALATFGQAQAADCVRTYGSQLPIPTTV